MRDLLCAFPRNDPSREARNGKVLGQTPTFDRDRGSGNFHAGRARFCVEKDKPGWLRLWGVAGSPSVDRSTKGDAPSSP